MGQCLQWMMDLLESTQHLCIFDFSTLEVEEGRRYSLAFSLLLLEYQISLKCANGVVYYLSLHPPLTININNMIIA